MLKLTVNNEEKTKNYRCFSTGFRNFENIFQSSNTLAFHVEVLLKLPFPARPLAVVYLNE